MPHAVFFDVGNTLLYPYPSVSEVCRRVLEDAGHTRDLEQIEAYMPLVDEYYEDRYREDDTFWTDEGETADIWVGMYSLLCRKLGIDEQAEELALKVYERFGDPGHWRLYDDVVPVLVRLRDKGCRLGIISNWDRRLSDLVVGLGIGDLLDAVVCSATVGLHKPDPRIFELACATLGVRPVDSVHVGDHHYADVLGAESVGMLAVLIDRHGGPPPRWSRFIRTLDDLESVVNVTDRRSL